MLSNPFDITKCIRAFPVRNNAAGYTADGCVKKCNLFRGEDHCE